MSRQAMAGGLAAGGLAALGGSAARAQGWPSVTPYENVWVRSGPATSYSGLFIFYAGDGLPAQCWVYGQTIKDNGLTNNFWVKLLDPSVPQYVSALYLKGNQYGGLTSGDEC